METKGKERRKMAIKLRTRERYPTIVYKIILRKVLITSKIKTLKKLRIIWLIKLMSNIFCIKAKDMIIIPIRFILQIIHQKVMFVAFQNFITSLSNKF